MFGDVAIQPLLCVIGGSRVSRDKQALAKPCNMAKLVLIHPHATGGAAGTFGCRISANTISSFAIGVASVALPIRPSTPLLRLVSCSQAPFAANQRRLRAAEY